MAIEITETGTTVTGPDILSLRWMTIRRGLKLEIETGMKMTRGRNMLAIVQGAGITTKRTKRGAYEDLDRWMVAQGFDSVPLKPAK
jgi:hypothetical protein